MTTTGQIRHAFPAYKVYIFGVDVTEDVLEVSIKNHKGNSPNICTVTLANEKDKYILTTQEMVLFFNEKTRKAIEDKYNKLLDQKNLKYSTNMDKAEGIADNEILRELEHISPAIKRRVLLSKITTRTDSKLEVKDAAGQKNGTSWRQLSGHVFRYPFHAEDPIFHANDPIRVFMRDPFDPTRWYHGFTGFLSDFDDHVDENNQKILTITAEGPSKILRYARISTNPQILDIDAIKVQGLDAVDRSFWGAGFYDITLPEFIFALIFGNDPEREIVQPYTGEKGGKFSITTKTPEGEVRASQIRFSGAGRFNYARSSVIEFGPNRGDSFDMGATPTCKVTSLHDYQSIIDHELKESDLENMLDETIGAVGSTSQSGDRGAVLAEIQDYLINRVHRRADGTASPHDLMDFLGTRTDLYPPDSGAVIMFIPASFHESANRNVLMKEVLKSPAMSGTDFRTRLSMIYETIDRIDFVFYESPKGDLIFEFPLYDFDPEDWGFDIVPKLIVSGSPTGNTRKLVPAKANGKQIKCGPFGNSWIVDKRDTFNFSKSITDEKVVTQVACHRELISGHMVEGSQGKLPVIAVTAAHLIPLYWARLVQVPPKGFIVTAEAATAYCNIMLNKMNADAKSMGINAVPNLAMWLNRPIYFLPKNCIGTLTGVSHSIKWGMGGAMDTRLNINTIRGWDGLLDADGKPVYTTIGGIPSRALNYKLLFGLTNVDEGNAVPAGTAILGEGPENIIE